MSFTTRLLSVFEGVKIALDALRANRVRALLTIMGVAIGVFVVVARRAISGCRFLEYARPPRRA